MPTAREGWAARFGGPSPVWVPNILLLDGPGAERVYEELGEIVPKEFMHGLLRAGGNGSGVVALKSALQQVTLDHFVSELHAQGWEIPSAAGKAVHVLYVHDGYHESALAKDGEALKQYLIGELSDGRCSITEVILCTEGSKEERQRVESVLRQKAEWRRYLVSCGNSAGLTYAPHDVFRIAARLLAAVLFGQSRGAGVHHPTHMLQDEHADASGRPNVCLVGMAEVVFPRQGLLQEALARSLCRLVRAPERRRQVSSEATRCSSEALDAVAKDLLREFSRLSPNRSVRSASDAKIWVDTFSKRIEEALSSALGPADADSWIPPGRLVEGLQAIVDCLTGIITQLDKLLLLPATAAEPGGRKNVCWLRRLFSLFGWRGASPPVAESVVPLDTNGGVKETREHLAQMRSRLETCLRAIRASVDDPGDAGPVPKISVSKSGPQLRISAACLPDTLAVSLVDGDKDSMVGRLGQVLSRAILSGHSQTWQQALFQIALGEAGELLPDDPNADFLLKGFPDLTERIKEFFGNIPLAGQPAVGKQGSGHLYWISDHPPSLFEEEFIRAAAVGAGLPNQAFRLVQPSNPTTLCALVVRTGAEVDGLKLFAREG